MPPAATAVAGVQLAWHVPPWQLPLRQSWFARQPWASGQAPQLAHPQSTPVSLPFFTPSLQLGAAQWPPVHTESWHLAELIADQDDLARRVVRGRVIQHLTSLGVPGPGGLVDAAIKTAAKVNDSMQGRSVILEAPVPWSDTVDGSELLDEMVAVFERYVILPPGAAVALAAWTLFTHALDAFTIAPMLALVSPEKRCGKTTTLDVVGALVPRKLPAANISPAALYRTVETVTPTLLVDEADAFLNRNEDLRGILNAGHPRDPLPIVGFINEVSVLHVDEAIVTDVRELKKGHPHIPALRLLRV